MDVISDVRGELDLDEVNETLVPVVGCCADLSWPLWCPLGTGMFFFMNINSHYSGKITFTMSKQFAMSTVVEGCVVQWFLAMCKLHRLTYGTDKCLDASAFFILFEYLLGIGFLLW